MGVVVVLHRQRPLLEMVLALIPPGGFAGCLHRWQQKSHEHADDRDHHQQFHERKAGGNADMPLSQRRHLQLPAKEKWSDKTNDRSLAGRQAAEPANLSCTQEDFQQSFPKPWLPRPFQRGSKSLYSWIPPNRRFQPAGSARMPAG
jgi:hypothetical protein